MIRTLAALLALTACPADPEPTDVDPPDTDTEVTRTPLPIPDEAVDLDADPDVVRIELSAAPHTFTIGEDEVQGYAYNGQVPGPTIRAKLGDRVEVQFTNDLEAPTTIHWHGLHVPFVMDGVPWTIAPIAPGDSFVYAFTVEQAGSFWYHPHFDTQHQVDLGLYGAFIVEDPAEPAVDQDIPVMLDSWGEATARTPDEGHDHHGVDGADLVWTLNGAIHPELPIAAGSTTRLRLYNASNAGYVDLDAPLDWIAGDQGLLSAASEGHQLLGPGDRRDAVVRMGTAPKTITNRPYSLYGGTIDEAVANPLLTITPEGAASAPAALPWAFDGAQPTADPGRTDILWVLQGDGSQGAWYINGERFPDISIPVLSPNEEAIIEVRNVSSTEHPLHMHGHAFEVLSINGDPPTHRWIEDTINIPIRGTARLRIVGGLVGWWMVHCHILPHADGGMMTVLEVRE